MIRAVIDSNVYISGILFGGKPRNVLDLAVRGKIEVFIAPDMLSEIKDVLARKKFGFSPLAIQTILYEIESIATIVFPSSNYKTVSRDYDDNMVVDCAMESNAAFIITGDNDLLSLGGFSDVRIINPAAFMDLFERG